MRNVSSHLLPERYLPVLAFGEDTSFGRVLLDVALYRELIELHPFLIQLHPYLIQLHPPLFCQCSKLLVLRRTFLLS